MENLFASLWIQLGCRLVKKQNLRFHGKNRSNGHTLHLSTGQIKWVLLPKLPDVQLMQNLIQAFLNLFSRYAKVFQPKGYFIPNSIFRSGKLVKRVLKDQPDFFAKFRSRCGSSNNSINSHFTSVSTFVKLRNQSAESLAERTFSRTILSDNSNEFSFLSSKGDIIQRQLFRMGIAIFQMFYF